MNWLMNIASNYIRFIASVLVMAIMTPIIIEAVGVEQYGLWAIVYAVIGLVSLADLGFATAAIKYALGGDAMMKQSRWPSIMADAAYAILGERDRPPSR